MNSRKKTLLITFVIYCIIFCVHHAYAMQQKQEQVPSLKELCIKTVLQIRQTTTSVHMLPYELHNEIRTIFSQHSPLLGNLYKNSITMKWYPAENVALCYEEIDTDTKSNCIALYDLSQAEYLETFCKNRMPIHQVLLLATIESAYYTHTHYVRLTPYEESIYNGLLPDIKKWLSSYMIIPHELFLTKIPKLIHEQFLGLINNEKIEKH